MILNNKCGLLLGLVGLLISASNVQAQSHERGEARQTAPDVQRQIDSASGALTGTATFPIVFCWYRGALALYIQTDASDPAVAKAQDVNLVAPLANVLTSQVAGYDDIYSVTNFTQGNVIPSAPIPAGPTNSDPSYSPLWQLSKVTWNSGKTPHVLKSEEEVRSAAAAGLVTITKTNVVLNCPVIYTPFGGKLPKVVIHIGSDDHDH